MNSDASIFVAGHRGLVGSSVLRRLQGGGYTKLLTRPRAELDLADAAAVFAFFERERPEYVVLGAAKVGGILANSTYPGDFIRDNLAIQSNVIEASRRAGRGDGAASTKSRTASPARPARGPHRHRAAA